MRGAKSEEWTKRREIHKKVLLGNLMEGTDLEDLGPDGKIVLKLIFKK